MKNRASLVLLGVILLAIFSGCTSTQSQTKNIVVSEKPIQTYEGKKVLYVDSYHAGYEWSDGIKRGIENIFNNTGVELKILRMDTKRNDRIVGLRGERKPPASAVGIANPLEL